MIRQLVLASLLSRRFAIDFIAKNLTKYITQIIIYHIRQR